MSSSPIQIPAVAGIPRTTRLFATLPHGEPVASTIFDSNGTRVFTAGRVLLEQLSVYCLHREPLRYGI